MKIIPLVLMLLASSVFSQDDVIITGRVLCDQPHPLPSLPIENVRLVLFSPPDRVQETRTDSNGIYFFKIKNNTASVELHTEVSKQSKTKNMKLDEGILNFKDVRRVVIARQDTIAQDFYLKRAIICSFFPELNFRFNSVEVVKDSIENDTNVPSEEGLNVIQQIMQDNPNIVIEVNAHCDKREKFAVSKKRSAFVVSELIKNGIDPKRLVAKNYGSSRPLIPDFVIKKAGSKEEKEALYSKNRRVSFRVLSTGFKE